jgi:DNA-binding GntR family transcriptional regulator
MERTTYEDHGRAIEFAQHVYRASRYSLSSTLMSDGPGGR